MIISIAVFYSTKCHQLLLTGAKIQTRQFSYGVAHLDCCQIVIIKHSRKHGMVLRSTLFLNLKLFLTFRTMFSLDIHFLYTC